MSEHLGEKDLDGLEQKINLKHNIGLMCVSSPMAQSLITALRTERESHQATRAELEAARRWRPVVLAAETLATHRADQVLQGNDNFSWYWFHNEIEALCDAYDTARAGEGGSDD